MNVVIGPSKEKLSILFHEDDLLDKKRERKSDDAKQFVVSMLIYITSNFVYKNCQQSTKEVDRNSEDVGPMKLDYDIKTSRNIFSLRLVSSVPQ